MKNSELKENIEGIAKNLDLMLRHIDFFHTHILDCHIYLRYLSEAVVDEVVKEEENEKRDCPDF